MWQSFLSLVIAALGKAVVDAFIGWYDEKKGEETIAKEAVAEAQTRTLQDIVETADAQSQVNAAHRGGAHDVARRVRERLARQGSGSDPAGGGS